MYVYSSKFCLLLGGNFQEKIRASHSYMLQNEYITLVGISVKILGLCGNDLAPNSICVLVCWYIAACIYIYN